MPLEVYLGEAVRDATADGLALVEDSVGADVQHCIGIHRAENKRGERARQYASSAKDACSLNGRCCGICPGRPAGRTQKGHPRPASPPASQPGQCRRPFQQKK